MSNTLVLLNNTLVRGNFLAGTSGFPTAVVFDSTKDEAFIADYESNDVTIVSLSTDSVVGWIMVGSNPRAIAYDPAVGRIFVANTGSNNISVISDSSDRVVATITTSSGAYGLAVDPANGELGATVGNSLALFSVSTNTLVGNVAVGCGPLGVTFDSGKSEFFVGNFCSASVSVISAATNKLVTTIGLGSGYPWGIGYDSSSGRVFATKYVGASSPSIAYLGNVSIISDASNSVVATVKVGGGPSSVVADPSAGMDFVGNYFSNTLSVISESTNKVVATVPDVDDSYGLDFDPSTAQIIACGGALVSVATYTVTTTLELNAEPTALAYDSGTGFVAVGDADSNSTRLVSGSIERVAKTIPLAADATAVAIADDAAQEELFVATSQSTVTVVAPGSGKLVATVPIDSGGMGGLDSIAFDSKRGEAFVSLNYCIPYGSEGGSICKGEVAVVSASTFSVLTMIPADFYPEGLAYDSATGQVFVANELYNNVSVISDVSNRIVATIPVGDGPINVAYDPGRAAVFVANQGSNNVSVISDSNDRVETSVHVGGSPSGVAYDPDTGDIFVANAGSGNVSVISDGTDTVIGSISVGGGPYGVVYDSESHTVDVGNYAQGTISFIPVTPGYYETTFDARGLPVGTMWFVNISGQPSLSSTTDAISVELTNATYSFTVGTVQKTYSAAGGFFSIAGAGLTMPVVFAPVTYSVTFVEVGLPSGATWWVNITGQSPLESTSGSTVIALTNGSYSYAAATATANTGGTGGLFTVDGHSLSRTVTFGVLSAVDFMESGLPSGTRWWVNVTGGSLNSGTGPTIDFREPNGTYAFRIATANKEYAGAGGSFTVNGTSVSESVTFRLVAFAVTFAESGLPPGTEWYVNVTGAPSQSSTTSTVTEALPNGSYTFRVATVDKEYAARGGVLGVTGAPPATQPVTFTKESYALTFTESGLTLTKHQEKTFDEEGWTVVLNGTPMHSTGTTITFSGVPNGTYPVLIYGPSGFDVTGSGTVGVHGTTNVSVTVSKGKTVTLAFKEKKLPSGTSWCVTVDGYTQCSTGKSVKFADLSPGTYSYEVGSVSGYTVTATIGKTTEPLSGSLDLTKSTTVKLTFKAS